MENDDIKKWINSSVYRKFKKELFMKKELMQNPDFMMHLNFDSVSKLPKKQLLVHINHILSDEEYYESDVNNAVVYHEFNHIYNEYIRQQVYWFLQLFHYSIDQEYEVCALIRDFVEHLEEELIFLLSNYRKEIFSPEVEGKIESINVLYKKILNQKIDDYNANDGNHHK